MDIPESAALDFSYASLDQVMYVALLLELWISLTEDDERCQL